MSNPEPRAPNVPGDLDATGAHLYRTLRTAMRDRPAGPTRWENSDHHLLSQACRLDQRARRAREGFKSNAVEMTTTGDRGQLTVHPLVKIAEGSERQFVDCLKELGFTPRARAQLGLERKKDGPSKFGL